MSLHFFLFFNIQRWKKKWFITCHGAAMQPSHHKSCLCDKTLIFKKVDSINHYCFLCPCPLTSEWLFSLQILKHISGRHICSKYLWRQQSGCSHILTSKARAKSLNKRFPWAGGSWDKMHISQTKTIWFEAASGGPQHLFNQSHSCPVRVLPRQRSPGALRLHRTCGGGPRDPRTSVPTAQNPQSSCPVQKSQDGTFSIPGIFKLGQDRVEYKRWRWDYSGERGGLPRQFCVSLELRDKAMVFRRFTSFVLTEFLIS